MKRSRTELSSLDHTEKSSVPIIRVNNTKNGKISIDPHFFYLLLTSDEMTDYLRTIAEGSTSTYPSLMLSDIGLITFLFPLEMKLRDFSIITNNGWAKIENNHIQIRILETLRDILLPKFMSGEVGAS